MAKNVSQVPQTFQRRLTSGLLIVSSVVLTCSAMTPTLRNVVFADSYQDQINALSAQNAQSRQQIDGLQAQAASYQDAINQLQAQIDGLQASIDQNVALQQDLQKQISAAEAEIDRQRALLGQDIKAMYVDGTPSSLEMLATSKNLSDFVDKQEYRTRVQNKIQDTLKTISDLEKQLQMQKAKVDQLLKEQQSQQSQLDSDRAKQQSLLSYNQSQQDTYNAQIKANNSQISQLQAAQAAANRRLGGGTAPIAGDPGHGGYPSQWDTAAKDSMLDSWGMYNRECVSYTAWKVYQAYGYMPYWGGHGNANEWPGNARAAGIPTGSTPRVGSVAIWNVGYYGHAMWVEAVNSDGSIWISQYNYDYTGHYSEMRVSPSMAASLTYIYFN